MNSYWTARSRMIEAEVAHLVKLGRAFRDPWILLLSATHRVDADFNRVLQGAAE